MPILFGSMVYKLQKAQREIINSLSSDVKIFNTLQEAILVVDK